MDEHGDGCVCLYSSTTIWTKFQSGLGLFKGLSAITYMGCFTKRFFNNILFLYFRVSILLGWSYLPHDKIRYWKIITNHE